MLTFLPVVERELLQACRRRSTHLTRLGIAAAGLVIGAWVMLIPEMSTPRTLGMFLFVPLSILTHLYCLLVGVFRTADCLSEEKREGTLGLLFLTDLRGYDVVLGKLVASSINAFYGALALLPVLAIPLLMGGVTVQEFGRVTMAAVNTLLLSLAVGMFCSCLSRDERRPMVASLLILLFFTAGLPILAGVLHRHLPHRAWAEYVLIPSPGYAAFKAFDVNFRKATSAINPFYASLLSTHLLSWTLLLASALILPRNWQDRPQTPATARFRVWLSRLRFGALGSRLRFRRRLLEVNPVYWLAARHRLKPLLGWLPILIAALVWGVGLIVDRREWLDEGHYMITALLVQTTMKFWVASEATRALSIERQSGALELLLATPLSIRDVIRGHILALERQFAAPVVAMLVADIIFILSGHHDSDARIVLGAFIAVFAADMVSLTWVGLWRGLNSSRPNRAAAVALLQLLVLPWVVFALLLTGAELGRSTFHLESWGTKSVVGLALGVALIIDLAFALPARRRLRRDLRTMATQSYASHDHRKP